MSKKTKQEYALENLESLADYYQNPQIVHAVNVEKLQELISSSKCKNVLLVFSSYWCSSCHKSMPELKRFYESNKDKVELIFISTVDWLETKEDRIYLNQYGFNNHPLLSVDIYQYGTEYMNWDRLENFIKELVPNYTGQIALPTYLLVDNKCKLLDFHNSEFKVDAIPLK